jgi:L-amino acid N-acyltransferase YncA
VASELKPSVTVRPATPDDASAIREIYAPAVRSTPVSFEERVPDPADLVRRMTAEPRLPWLVAEVGGEVAGYAYATQYRTRPAYRWSAECSVYLAAAHRGQGIGRLLYERLVPEVRELGYVTLLAGITLPNPASVGLHQALGFQPAGVLPAVGFKLGAWHDVSWWALALHADPPTDPPEPRAWTPGCCELNRVPHP